jgi:hypothetical protein
MPGIGTTISSSFSYGRGLFSPDQIDDLAYWLEPTLSTVQLSTDNVLVDGNFSDDGYANWTFAGTGDCEKAINDNPNSSNPNCFKLYAGGTCYVIGSPLITNQAYRISGYMKGNGSNALPQIWNYATGALVAGTTSATWQSFSTEFTAVADSRICLFTDDIGTVAFSDLKLEIITLLDGYQELDGYSNYSGWHAVLSKTTANPHSGTQCLKLSYDGINTYGVASQSTLTASGNYRLHGYAKGNGACRPIIQITGATVFAGTTASNWQKTDLTFSAPDTAIYLASDNLAADGYVCFDDLWVEKLPLLNANFSDGYNYWTGSNNAVLSVVSSTSPNLENALRITNTVANAMAYQRATLIGKSYRVRGYCLSDGYAIPKIYDYNSAIPFVGVNSHTDWQEIDFIYTAQAEYMVFYAISSTNGQFVEFTELNVEELPNVLQLRDKSTNHRNIEQSTVANYPAYLSSYINSKDVIWFDGVSDRLKTTFALAQPLTIFLLAKVRNTVEGYSYILDGGTDDHCALYRGSLSRNVSPYAGTTPGAITISDDNIHVIDTTFNGASSAIGLDGGTQITGNAGTSDPSGLTLGSSGGTGSFFSPLNLIAIIGYNKVLSTTERKNVVNYLKKLANI